MEKPKCIDCEYFAWWDGDYCCLPESGEWCIITPSEKGEFTDKTVEDLSLMSSKCKKFKKRENKKMLEIYNNLWEEYVNGENKE